MPLDRISLSQPPASRAERATLRGPRIALYSHDTMGLGHLRRNLLIAQTLSYSELAATSLLITGAHETNFFPLPDGVDCVTLPRISKDQSGEYHSANLGISVDALTRLRQKSICSALEEFEPDVLIVDKVPMGACGEMLPALESLARRGRTRCILGLRDILDDSSAVRRDWLNRQNIEVLDRLYDAIWIYGDPHIYDPVREYGFPESISGKTRFTGYLNQSSRIRSHWNGNHCGTNGDALPRNKKVVCVVGGGQDGVKLVEAFIDALPPDIDGIVLTGPYLPQSVLHSARQVTSVLSNIQILDFTPEADLLIATADRVVGMAGYNTVCSILSFCTPALLVPRIAPRREQWIRAERLRELQLVDVISPDQLTSRNLAAWLQQPLRNSSGARHFVDLNGLDRIVEWVTALVGHATNGSPVAPVAALQS
jgi:predicted glycosyltransferase